MNVRPMMPLAIGSAMLLAACGGGDGGSADGGASRGGAVDLTGAGATFPFPIYSRWFDDYDRQQHVRINYGALGSGAGIRQLSEQTVDFGASDSPMSDEELANAKGGPVLHIPTVLGAVVVTYNLQGLTQPLKLDGGVIADVFMGKITRWNDPRIAATNAGVTLPVQDILVVHRTDASGTSFIFTDYLSSVSPAWSNGPGRGKQVNWPTGLGAKGNDGVSAQVKQTPGAIGYTELAYVKQNQLPSAAVRNRAGNYVEPTLDNIQAAAAGALDSLPPDTDFRVSIVNAPGAQAYPISSFTWLLVYRQVADTAKARKLVDFIRWAISDGDDRARELDYAPLPDALQQRVFQRLDSLQVGGAR